MIKSSTGRGAYQPHRSLDISVRRGLAIGDCQRDRGELCHRVGSILMGWAGDGRHVPNLPWRPFVCPSQVSRKAQRRYPRAPCETASTLQMVIWKDPAQGRPPYPRIRACTGVFRQSTATFSPAAMSILPRSVGSMARIISANLASCGEVSVATRGRFLGRGCIFSFLTCL